ncbi:hypothetical protein PI124_g17976 [Phytophthora idaei]|nr:hypothetical protein PI125_g21362 [Phytophthora idaei]KAG3137846.1 hypothetical protein PI126_g17203 [Phytophthora idaei]KAG3237025.1 hypothetical protein PI124_g17976 [Phytophthora idaei]
MWVKREDESNGDQRWQRNSSPGKPTEWNQRRRARNPAFRSDSPAKRLRDMSKFKEIKPHALANFIGLLCARTLCPHRGSLSRHWATNAQGTVPKGIFGKFMARRRFEVSVRYLHFRSNDDPDVCRVKPWKIKPVADDIEECFNAGMTVRPRLPFDEGVVPMRSRFNAMRQYLKATPRQSVISHVALRPGTATKPRYTKGERPVIDVICCCQKM